MNLMFQNVVNSGLLFSMERFSFLRMKFFLMLGADPNQDVGFVDRPGYHLVTRAARSGNAELLTILLRYGGDPNAVSSGFPTILPIHMAVVKDHSSCIDALFEHGADLQRKCQLHGSVDWLTPLELAKRLGKPCALNVLEGLALRKTLPD